MRIGSHVLVLNRYPAAIRRLWAYCISEKKYTWHVRPKCGSGLHIMAKVLSLEPPSLLFSLHQRTMHFYHAINQTSLWHLSLGACQ